MAKIISQTLIDCYSCPFSYRPEGINWFTNDRHSYRCKKMNSEIDQPSEIAGFCPLPDEDTFEYVLRKRSVI